MRWTAPLLVLLAASAAAQTAVPDTTAPERFYPLDVGNRWEYGPWPHGRDGAPSTHYRVMIVGDTLVGGVRWAVQREQAFAFEGTHYAKQWERVSDERTLVRFDPDVRGVVRDAGGGAVPVYPCPFDVPFTPPDETGTCGGGVSYTKRRVERPPFAIYQYQGVALTFGTGGALAEGVGPARHPGAPGDTLAFARTQEWVRDQPFDSMPCLPDPTPPASYYPLGVGDQWVYSWFNPILTGYRRRSVARDTVADGRTYAVVEYAEYDRNAADPEWEAQGTHLFRFDPETTHVFERADDGTESIAICALGADFRAPIDCGGGTAERRLRHLPLLQPQRS